MGYMLEPHNRWVEAMAGICAFEIRPGNTVTLASEVDLTEVGSLRGTMTPKPSYTAFVVKSLALTLRHMPHANRRLCRSPWWPFARRMQRFDSCDVLVNGERHVEGAESVTFADICHDADKKSVKEINAWLRQLAVADESNNAQWRTFSKLIRRCPAWLAKYLIRLPCYFPSLWPKYRGGAAQISSPAKYGVDYMIGSWNAPLGVSFGLVKERPVVKNGQVVPCLTTILSLNFDRRVMAGAPAARFLRHWIDLLESPRSWAMEAAAQTEVTPAQPEDAANLPDRSFGGHVTGLANGSMS